MFDSKEFRRALGQFLTGVTVVTARAADGTPVGLTANSFTSVSLEPPLVLVCLDKRLGAFPAFVLGGGYAVHVLGSEQMELSARFASKGIDKFAGLSVSEGWGGAPLLPDCLARFECEVVAAHDAGDHVIFVGHVHHFVISDGDRPPLGYLRGKYATGQPLV